MLAKKLLLAGCLFLPVSAASQAIRIGGDDNLILLGQRWAALYAQSHGTPLHVEGTGSHTPLPRLANGELDIVQTRRMAQRTETVSFPVAIEAITFIVNPVNPVNQLSVAQVRDIYLGKITNWKQVGGADLQIQLFAADSSTGTLDYFNDAILDGAEPYPFAGKATNKDLAEAVASARGALGFASAGTFAGVKTLRIDAGHGGVEPTGENVRARRYPVTRYVYWSARKNASPAVRTLIDWVLGSQGQLVVESIGFLPLLPDDRKEARAKLGP